MENNSDTEMELLYEEVVGDVSCHTTNNSRAASPKSKNWLTVLPGDSLSKGSL